MGKTAERQQKILEFMRNEVETKGYPPTVREICKSQGISSTSTVHSDINTLVKQGYLKKDPSKTRAIRVVDKSMIKEWPEKRKDIIDVPIVGNVAAGSPILAEQNIEETFPVHSAYANENNFMLRVRGESMINVGIMDGDLILIEQQNTARNGEIVVAMVDGFDCEATVKTFYKENGHIRLQPENDTMEPIIVDDVKIVGKVKGVFRYFN